jgi:threonylcarbamoyladenosine tRNA methylthiotransferase MtaB
LKYAVLTFGCRVNQADSLGFEESLRRSGASAAPPESADVVVVNTCSVTASADQGARQSIRRLARVNPSARIVVTGCYATRARGEVRNLPNVACVVPNDDKHRLVSLIGGLRTQAGQTSAERFGDGDGSCGAAVEPGVAGRTAYTLRVQTGCDEPCTYCIIPSTRGAPRSLPISAVLEEVGRVVSCGFKEIALTGVHLGSYGRDLPQRVSLSDLLAALARHGDGVLFRISSLEPMDCTGDVLETVAGHTCFAPHFHLPLQHASNRLLAAMRRPYTLEQYATLVARVRERIPGASIGSDVIVGFPGETEASFEKLVCFLRGSPLTHVHVFPYSDRPGTVAASMGGKVPGVVVRDRALRVREVSAALTRAFHERQIGTVHRALTIGDGSVAVTGHYLKLRIPPGRGRNEWVRVRVISHDAGELLAG